MMLTESVPILSGPSLVLAKKDTKATEFDVDVSNIHHSLRSIEIDKNKSI